MPHLQSSRFSGFAAFTPTALNFHNISLLTARLREQDAELAEKKKKTTTKPSTAASQRTQARGTASTVLAARGGPDATGLGRGQGSLAFKTLSGF